MMIKDLVSISGSPSQAGEAYGRATTACIQRYLGDFLTNVEVEGIGRDEVRRRTDLYVGIVDRLAPWWHDEMAGIARGADVPLDDYTAYVAQKYVIRTTRPPSPPPAPHECTSFLSVGRGSLDGASILHKNRDSAARPQGLWVHAVEGSLRYLGGGDAGDHGVIHFVNERGLAGAMNAGSPNQDTVPEGLPTPQILKLIAERAGSCAEALEILREVVGNGWYTNGICGSIWLFVDHERGLIVENTRHSFDWIWIDDAAVARTNDFLLPGTKRWSRPDAETNTRYLAARDGVGALADQVTTRAFQALSRDEATEPRPVCNDSTLSGFTAVVDDGSLRAEVAIGHPATGLYVPFYVDATGVPSWVIDGSLWTATVRVRQQRQAGATVETGAADFEARLAVDRALLEASVRDAPAEQRISALTQASATWAADAYRRLSLAGAPA